MTAVGNSLLVSEHSTATGHVVAAATLNSEATLNSLSLTMAEGLMAKLDEWADRQEVVCVFIRGAGDRAFCAGGDIQDLHRAMRANHEAGEVVDPLPDTFFEAEYRLDYKIHTYPKPVVVFGHGIVMGGGLGIWSAASHALVTERTRIAMPEVTIGLFPDAGATWILRNLALPKALWLGATGSQINGADALALKLAFAAVPGDADVLDALLSTDWNVQGALEHGLGELHEADLPDGNFESIDHALGERVVGLPESVKATESLLAPMASLGQWGERGVATMRAGCPTSIAILLEQLERSRTMSLVDCFRMEMVIASNCARNGDFVEGIRALLIDKDNAPAWQDIAAADLARHAASHFDPPWPENPLADI